MQTNKGHGYIDCCTIVIRSNDYFFVICINFYHYYIRKNATNRENRPGGCLCQLPWFKKKVCFFQKDIKKIAFLFLIWYILSFFPILNIDTKYIEYNNIPFFLSLRCILLRIVNNIRVFVTFHTISCFLGLVFFRSLVIIIANPNIFDGISQLITTVPRG